MSRLAHYYAQMDKVYGLYADATVALFHDRALDKPLGDTLAPFDAGSMANAVEAVMTRIKF